MRSDCCITVTVYQLWQDHNPQHSTTKLRQDGFSFRALTFDLMLWDGLRSLSYFNVKKKPHIKQSRSSEHLHLASLFHVGGFQESFTNAHKVYPVYPICTQKLSHGIASKSVKCVCFWRLCGTVPKSVAGFPFKKSSCTFEVCTKSTQGPNVKHVATTRWAVWFSTNNGFDYTKYKLFHLLILQIHSIQVFQIQNNRHCSQRIVSHNITPAFQLLQKRNPKHFVLKLSHCAGQVIWCLRRAVAEKFRWRVPNKTSNLQSTTKNKTKGRCCVKLYHEWATKSKECRKNR